MISIPFQGKPFNMSIIEVYGSTTDGKEAEANQFYEDLQDFLELTPKKKTMSFHPEGLECKTRISSDTRSNRPSLALAYKMKWGQRLTELCQENALIIANTLFQQHKRQLYTWTSPDGQYQNQINYILCNQRWRSSIQSVKNKTVS